MVEQTCFGGVDPDVPKGSKASVVLLLLEENALPKGSELWNGSACCKEKNTRSDNKWHCNKSIANDCMIYGYSKPTSPIAQPAGVA